MRSADSTETRAALLSPSQPSSPIPTIDSHGFVMVCILGGLAPELANFRVSRRTKKQSRAERRRDPQELRRARRQLLQERDAPRRRLLPQSPEPEERLAGR